MANESVYCVGVSTPKIMWLRLLILLLLSTICLNLVEAQGRVKSYRYGFKHLPAQILYFKGSNNILYHDFSGNVWLSTNAGERWKEISDVPGNVAAALIKHPFSEDRAYILTTDTIHYKTTDKGETWKEFTTPTAPTKKTSVLSFHAIQKDWLLFKGTECKRWFECKDVTYYTEDNFNNNPKLLLENTERCIWARSSSKFDEAPTKSIFCIQNDGSGSTRKLNDYRLIESQDYFGSTEIIDFNSGGDVRGVIGLGETQEFIVAAVKYPDLKMYVSRDGRNWTRAIFPLNKGPLSKEEEAYTILESPTDHLVVDLLSDESKAGNLFISNSKGTYFVKRLNDTHRGKDGHVDFRQSQGGNGFVQDVGGILVANIVYNYKEITEIDDPRTKLQSRISFDDGITWKPIKPPEKNFNDKDFPCKERKEKEEKCSLHLHLVIDPHNRGLIFAANAPGVLMGVGHVGEHLLPYDQCDTFFSYDGGVTWKVVKNPGAHMYAIGQYGSILVIVDDEQLTDVVFYSVDRGQTWNNMTFSSQGMKIRAKYLITDPEATSKSFILLGSSVPDGSTGNRHFTFKLDFSEYFSRDCDKDDFDGWVPQRSADYNCFMGAETTYYRRRPDAKCFVSKVSEPDTEPDSKFCACTENDYECDENYVLAEDGKNCLPLVPEHIPEGECEDGKKTYTGSSGFKKIEESQCDPEKGDVKLDEPVQRKCDFVPIYGEISHRTSYFTIDSSYFYFSESQILMVKTTDGIVKRSKDDGTTWENVLSGAGPIAYMFLHDHNGTRAYFFPERADESNKYNMWYTSDRGENFEKIPLEKEHNKLNLKILDFHPKHHDWLLFMASTPCPGSGCHSIAYFSLNNGKKWQEIETWADKCQFGVDTDFSETEDNAVFCSLYKDKNSKISQDKLGGRTSDANPIQLYKLKLKTNEKDKKDEKDRKFILDHTVTFFIFNEFMAAAKEERGQLLLYTSINGSTFNQAAFPPNLVVDKQAYTILPSNTGSIFLDVYKSTHFGSLFKSNSNATAFNRILDNTNRNAYGSVDFEKVHELDGIIIANQIDELSDYVNKKIITKISYDDGSHWKRLKMNNSGECRDDCYLNLHGRTDTYGLGSIFSAPSAIGLLIGVGNEGPYLLPYEQCNTYMSRDAGRTWTKIRHGASLYKFGDQGTIIVVVDNKEPTDQVLYSWNYGKDWNTYKFSSNPVRAIHLTTNSNSTSMKFLLYGSTREYSPVIITIDFSQLEKRKCEKGDFEYWNPMDDHSEDHKCLLGQKVQYQRRKADSECHIGEFEIMPSNPEACPCTKHDFECADGYWNNAEGGCELMGPDPDRPANCQGKYLARLGYVKMKKTKCQGGIDLEKEVEKKDCKSGNSIVSKTSVLTQRIANYFYFNESKTILALTMDNAVRQGTDEGHTWEIPNKLKDVKVYAILQNPYFNDHAYCITQDKIFYTSDSGINFEEIKVPMDPNNLQLPILDFHPDKQGYLIYTGSKSCDFTSTNCTAEAFYTKDNGKNWESIEKYVRKCLWGRTDKFKKAPDENLIICESYRDKEGSQLSFYDNPIQLLYVTSFKNKKVHNENIVGTALVEEYMIVAELMPSGQSLRLLISLDTNIFAEAQFPSNIPVVQEAYTALQSTTNSIMLHVTTSTTTRNKYGSILKSNENGTYYSLSLDNANRDDAGYVDFEKMLGIHGIALANIVSNVYEVNMGYNKKLKSMITFNDGAKWSPLNKPDHDSNNRAYTCNGDIENCSLHLHSFTERRNPRDSLSSSSAIGLMISVGNVGKYLTRYEQGDTFLTTDAGVTWNEIIKGAYMYEFGNQGGIIVLVDDKKPTEYVLYSLNEGKAWQKYNFIKVGEQPIKVLDIDTMPGGLSSKFILRGFNPSHIDEEVIVHLDFSNIHSKNCIFDSDKPDKSDFVQWSPNISTEDGCLFGHKITYFRKKPDSECFIDDNLKDKKERGENCKCTDDDFECDYNFIRNGTNDCVLYPGRKPLHLSQAEQCANGGTVWTELSGYRKLTSSTCEAGNIPSKYKEHPCPRGHSALFWIIIVLSPFIIVGILTYCFIRGRHGRFGYSPIGRIRLGSSIEPDSILSSIADIFYQIRMPRFVSRLWSGIPLPGRRNRYHYSPVATDDGHEVLMDDYEPDNETL